MRLTSACAAKSEPVRPPDPVRISASASFKATCSSCSWRGTACRTRGTRMRCAKWAAPPTSNVGLVGTPCAAMANSFFNAWTSDCRSAPRP
eukprot:Skav216659  [mRNA]  locus=scaffold1255:662192:667793:+ [translate_table: standard]